MSEQWYYSKTGQRCGPVPKEQLEQLLSSGQVQPTDLVWKQGMASWTKASEVGLLPAAALPAGPPDVPPQQPPPELKSSLTFDWKNWNLAGKTIFVSTCVAAASMLIKWVDVGLASANGLSQGTVLFLGLFIYPLLMLLKNRPINLVGGATCGGVGILCSVVYIASKEIEIFGHSVNAAAGGPYVFLLCCIALIVGVVKYKPATK